MAVPDAGVSTRVVRPIVAGLLLHGQDVEAALTGVGLDPATIADHDARVPHRAAAELWALATEQTGVPTFGLRVVEAMDLGTFDVQIYAFISSPTLGEGLERLQRFHRLNHDAALLSIRRTSTEAICRHRLPGGHVLPPAAAQFVLGTMVRAAREATDGRVEIREIRFEHSQPDDVSDYDRVLAAPIRFGCDANEVVLPLHALDLPLLKADPGLVAVLDRHGQALLDALPRVDSLADRVRTLLMKELQGGNPAAETIAEHLHMSVRTLARRLAEEDTSHKALLDELRSDLARRYLSDAGLAISEVAFLLGFSEPSAFHRAFKRWTGQTPRQFRSGP